MKILLYDRMIYDNVLKNSYFYSHANENAIDFFEVHLIKLSLG